MMFNDRFEQCLTAGYTQTVRVQMQVSHQFKNWSGARSIRTIWFGKAERLVYDGIRDMCVSK
jgi:hypothetical protein